MEEFNNVGVKSSDVYYIHHDKLLKKKDELKGGAHAYAEMLKKQHNTMLEDKRRRMHQETEDRLNDIQK